MLMIPKTLNTHSVVYANDTALLANHHNLN